MNPSKSKPIHHETDLTHHQPDLNEAIYYLPPNIDQKLICSALKTIYPEKGKQLALDWYHKSKNTLPSDFEAIWEDLSFSSYQLHTFDDHLNQ